MLLFRRGVGSMQHGRSRVGTASGAKQLATEEAQAAQNFALAVGYVHLELQEISDLLQAVVAVVLQERELILPFSLERWANIFGKIDEVGVLLSDAEKAD